MKSIRRWAIGAAACAAVVVPAVALASQSEGAVGGGPAAQTQEVCTERQVVLEAGWNIVTWTGPDLEIADATAEIAGDFDLIMSWDPQFQFFLSYSPRFPEALNDFHLLISGQPYWIHATVPVRVSWIQPVVGLDEARTWLIHSGWNLVSWTGPDTPSEVAFAPDAFEAPSVAQSPFVAAYSWVPAAGQFFSYNPLLPESLNYLLAPLYGDALWIRSRALTHWHQPAAGPDVDCTIYDIGTYGPA